MTTTVLAVAAAGWGVLMGISPVLQVRRMLIARSSREVSIGYFVVLALGFALWIAYGVASANLVLIVPNVVALAVSAATVVVALRLRREPAGRGYPATVGRSTRLAANRSSEVTSSTIRPDR
ncbi:MAG: SemiSWEET family transporter [Actinomycetes bacterium]